MQLKIYTLLLSSLLFLFPSSYAQYRVVKVQDSLQTYPEGKGFFYTLPKSYIAVYMKVSKTEKHKGPFADYAEKLLGLSSVIQENSARYSIQEMHFDVKLTPDLSEIYFVEYPRNSQDTVWRQFFQCGWAMHNLNITDKEAYTKQKQLSFQYPNEAYQAQFEMYDNYTMYEKIDTTYETAFIDSSYVRIPKFEKKMVAKTTEQKAQEALEQIKLIREAQWLLLTGDHEVNFHNIEFMVSSLKEQEQTYLSLFTGFTTTEESEYVLYFDLPEKQEMVKLPLFSFSASNGLNPQIQSKDTVYYLCLKNKNHTTPLQSFLENRAHTDKKKILHSFYYRIPEYYEVYFYQNEKVIKDAGLVPIHQYGLIDALPANIESLEIDPSTGQVRNLSFKKK